MVLIFLCNMSSQAATFVYREIRKNNYTIT